MNEIMNALVPIEAIQPHLRNYKVHPPLQIADLKASHQRFSQYRSVVIWQRPNNAYIQVAGHGIVEAMKERGVTHVRADILPMDTPEEDIEGIMIADNQLPLGANENEELLAMLLQEQQEAGFDLHSLGTDDETLRDMLATQRPPTLDELTAQYGDEPEDTDFWPIIRVKVSPETKEVYDSLMEKAEGTDENIKFAWILERVNVIEAVEM